MVAAGSLLTRMAIVFLDLKREEENWTHSSCLVRSRRVGLTCINRQALWKQKGSLMASVIKDVEAKF